MLGEWLILYGQAVAARRTQKQATGNSSDTDSQRTVLGILGVIQPQKAEYTKRKLVRQ